MRVLGIEASGDVAGVALADERGIYAELSFRHNMQLSRDLLPAVRDLVRTAGCEVSDLGGISVSLGPGSFTGLRIAVSTAKTLAYALNVPICGVGTLYALAYSFPVPRTALVCALLSASPTEVFAALYQWGETGPEPRAEKFCSRRPTAGRLARTPLDIVVVGQVGVHRAALEHAGPRLIIPAEDRSPSAAAVALLGRTRLITGASDEVQHTCATLPASVHGRKPASGGNGSARVNPEPPCVRTMTREDVPEVSAIDHLCFPIPWGEYTFAAELTNTAGYYRVAQAGNRVIGYIGAQIILDEAHITTFGVDPELRRRHIGEHLLADLLEEALRRGCRRLTLEVRAGNEAAAGLYRKYGFSPVSRRPRYYSDNNEDAIVMWIEDLTRPQYQTLLRERLADLEAL